MAQLCVINSKMSGCQSTACPQRWNDDFRSVLRYLHEENPLRVRKRPFSLTLITQAPSAAVWADSVFIRESTNKFRQTHQPGIQEQCKDNSQPATQPTVRAKYRLHCISSRSGDCQQTVWSCGSKPNDSILTMETHLEDFVMSWPPQHWGWWKETLRRIAKACEIFTWPWVTVDSCLSPSHSVAVTTVATFEVKKGEDISLEAHSIASLSSIILTRGAFPWSIRFQLPGGLEILLRSSCTAPGHRACRGRCKLSASVFCWLPGFSGPPPFLCHVLKV